MSTDQFTGRFAVLRDYPLRLWEQQQEHLQGLLREFELLVMGEESGITESSPPVQLLQLAELFTSRFGQTIDALAAERRAALDRGQDRMDSRMPLAVGTPELLERVASVLAAADAYCASGDLLTLPRAPVLVALSEWSLRELTLQYDGAEPTPWPGPF